MSALTTILTIILFILILVMIVAIIYNKKRDLDTKKQNRRMYQQNPSMYNQPPQPTNQQPYNVNQQSNLFVPKKVTFEVPAFVRSIQTTTRNSFVIGVEIESNDKISLNQQIALIGEEIIKEDLKRIESTQQSKEPQIEDKLTELLNLMKQNPTETKKIILKTPEKQSDPVTYSNEDIIKMVEKKPQKIVQNKPKKKIKSKKMSWDKKRPQKEFECTKCHTKRKTRWTPTTPDEKYVCYVCKGKE